MDSEIQKLQKRLLRERKARIEAEKLAEKATLSLYRKSQVEEMRNHELREFMWIASHDLSEPLRKIQINLSMLQKKDTNSEKLDKIENLTERMRELLHEFNNYLSCGESAKPELIEARPHVDFCIDNLQSQIDDCGAKIRIEPLPQLHCDPDHFRQIMAQLLTNALRYRKPDTAPLIEISSSDCPDNPFTHSCVVVRDNGIGIESNFAEMMFRPFGRGLHNSGIGIGLSICRKLAHANHGTIRATGEPGVGTSVSVSLPREPVS